MTALTAAEFETAVGKPLEMFAHQCHAASLALVRSGVLGPARVARGTCPDVGGQHSWVVLGTDAYDRRAEVVDPTLWSYVPSITGIWTGKALTRPHRPKGFGSIWDYGQPVHGGGATIPLNRDGLSHEAVAFLELVEPLDFRGWIALSNAPVGDRDWPAREIFERILDTPGLESLIPIDIEGMLTDRNPGGLYLATEPKALD